MNREQRRRARRRYGQGSDLEVVASWLCTDPNCSEGIHHLDPFEGGDSDPDDEERPRLVTEGAPATHPNSYFGGATGADSTQL